MNNGLTTTILILRNILLDTIIICILLLLLLHILLLHRATLVNLKPKWVKDRTLDAVVSREKHLQTLLNLISSSHNPHNLKGPTSLLRRFPAIFNPNNCSNSFSLTPSSLSLHHLLLHTLHISEPDLISRLQKLLLLSLSRSLPLHTLHLLHFDLALPPSFPQSLLPRYPHLFRLSQPPNDQRIWLHLLLSQDQDQDLPLSHLEKRYQETPNDGCLAFPVSFTRGFGLRKKCVSWLREWQTLPYISPFKGIPPEGLDPRTDVAEKRMVGVFHEMLHLMVGKKTERRNVSNMRKCLGLPQKFTKVFERHPGIFYLSRKLGRETVVLREGYGGGRELVEKHPVVEVREKWLELMRVRREDMEEEEEEEEEDADDDCVEENISEDEDCGGETIVHER